MVAPGRVAGKCPQRMLSGRLADVLDRIDRSPAMPDLEMQVRPGRPACRAHQRDLLPRLDPVARRHQVPVIMGISRDITITVVNLDHVAITGPWPGLSHNTTGNRHDVAAALAGKVDATMTGRLAAERVSAFTKVT